MLAEMIVAQDCIRSVGEVAYEHADVLVWGLFEHGLQLKILNGEAKPLSSILIVVNYRHAGNCFAGNSQRHVYPPRSGSSMTISAPPSSQCSMASTLPPKSMTESRTIVRPRPVPFLRVVWPGSQMSFLLIPSIPGPLSSTWIIRTPL